MGRKSKLSRLPPEQRRYIDRLLREDRLTLDEMLVDIRSKFPESDLPARPNLGRYKAQAMALGQRMREIQAASAVMVKEFGEDPHDRAGQLLVEAITSLATRATLQAEENGEANTKEIGQLARNARAVMEARKMSMAERQEIAREARALALDEVKQAAKASGVSEETMRAIDARLMGAT